MQISKLKNLLTRVNIKTDEVVQTPQIRTLLFTTNQGIDYHRDFIKFDTTNGLILIKQYKAKGASGRISEFSLSNDKKTLLSGGQISYCHPKYPYRRVKTGDKLFILNRTNGTITKTYDVVSVSYGSLTISAPLEFDPSKEVVCYTGDYSEMVQDVRDKSLFLTYTPYTEKVVDVYLDMDALIGIEFVCPKIGNG